MNKKEVMEIKKQYKIKDCSVSRLAGAYIDSDKNIVSFFNDYYQTKEEDEQFKYLDIFKKGLSGKEGKNIRTFEVGDEDYKRSLSFLQSSNLSESSNEAIESFLEKLNESCDITNSLVFLMSNAYDIPVKNKDNMKDGESDEVYSYIAGYICPLKKEKPGLFFDDASGKFLKKELRFCVDAPVFSFMYPSFEDRCSDYDKIMIYTKKTGDEFDGLISAMFSNEKKNSADAQQDMFNSMLEAAIADSDVDAVDMVKEISKGISNVLESDVDAIEINTEKVVDAFVRAGVSEEVLDPFVNENNSVMSSSVVKQDDVKVSGEGISVSVKADKAEKIQKKEIDGKVYLMIDVTETALNVNGINIGSEE